MIFCYKIVLNKCISGVEAYSLTSAIYKNMLIFFEDCKIKMDKESIIYLSRIPKLEAFRFITIINGFLYASFSCKIIINGNNIKIRLSLLRYLFFLIPLILIILQMNQFIRKLPPYTELFLVVLFGFGIFIYSSSVVFVKINSDYGHPFL